MTIHNRLAFNPAREVLLTNHRDTGANDSKGRPVGFKVTITREDYQPAAEGDCAVLIPAEFGLTVFAVRIQMTRDGKNYGASQRDHDFRTELDAREYAMITIDKRVRAARKKFS